MYRSRILAAALVLGLVAVAAGAEQQVRPRQFGSVTRYTVELDKALRDGRRLTLHLGWQDGAFTQAWGHVQGFSRIVDNLDPSGLTVDEDRLQGTIRLNAVHDGEGRGLTAEYRLDLAIGDPLKGRYEGWWAKRTGDLVYSVDSLVVTRDQVRWETKERFEVSGTATGRLRKEPELRQGNAVASGRDWPWWHGPNCDFSAPPSDRALIQDMRHARLVWRSEKTPPARCQVARYGEGALRRVLERGSPAGGGASPILADGKVYLWYFQPDGKSYEQSIVRGMEAKGNHTMTSMWSKRAEDVFLCLDAATGRTVWKLTLPGGHYMAMNGRNGSTKGWYTTNMAAADGKVYGATTEDVTYCLDGATGEVVWKRRLGMSSHRIVVDGVLLPSGENLVGYDAQTGKKLWSIDGVNSTRRPPLRYVHGDEQFVVAGNADGVIVCVEPRTGHERWRITGVGHNDKHLLIADDHLIVNLTPGEESEGNQLGAFRISPDGFEKAWELPRRYHYFPYRKYPLAHDGKLYHQVNRAKQLPKDLKTVSQRMVCVDLASGKVLAETPGLIADGMAYQLGPMLMLQLDSTHSKTPLQAYNTDPQHFQPLGGRWETDHTTTSSYWPTLMAHAIGDGRVFIRGAMGIYCYDLRRSPEYDEMRQAIAQADDAAKKLRGFLQHDNPAVTIDAADALGRMGPFAADAAPTLLQMARDGNAAQADAACRALARMGQAAVPVCASATESDDDAQRRTAVVALGCIGPAGPQALESLRRRLTDDVLAVRVAAVQSAELWAADARPLVPDLVALYKKDDDPQVDHAVVKAMIVIQPQTPLPESFIPPLVNILTTHASDEGYPAGHLLVRMGRAALPALIEAVRSDSRLASWRAAYAVGQIGPEARDAVPALREALAKARKRNRSTWARMLQTALEKVQSR